MRSEREIREKISEYIDKTSGVCMTALERQNRYGIIDALLWVIEDRSGKPI